jgi:hypothetical protein
VVGDGGGGGTGPPPEKFVSLTASTKTTHNRNARNAIIVISSKAVVKSFVPKDLPKSLQEKSCLRIKFPREPNQLERIISENGNAFIH